MIAASFSDSTRLAALACASNSASIRGSSWSRFKSLRHKGELANGTARPAVRATPAGRPMYLPKPGLGRSSIVHFRSPKMPLDDSGRARLRPSRQRLSRLSGSFALPNKSRADELNSGGRGSVRAGKGYRGSAGASPSQKPEPTNLTREGEALSEPAKAIAAQQELRPPKT